MNELPGGSYSVTDISDCLKYIIKKNETVTYNLPIRIYVNKIENRITFTIKTGYHLELLTSETMKLPGSTKGKVTDDENGGNVPNLEITEVVLVHFNISAMIISKIQEFCIHLFLIFKTLNH